MSEFQHGVGGGGGGVGIIFFFLVQKFQFENTGVISLLFDCSGLLLGPLIIGSFLSKYLIFKIKKKGLESGLQKPKAPQFEYLFFEFWPISKINK